MTARRRIVSIVQWAGIAGLADDGTSLAAARRLVAKGGGPKIVRIDERDGVRLRDHEKWARSKPWAKYLTSSAAAERQKRQRQLKRRSK